MENNDFWGIHKHHIVFRSQGGLDFDLNMIELTQEEHEGNHGPHQSRARDLELKRGLQEQLSELFPEGETFDIDTISRKLGRTRRYFEKYFKKVPNMAGMYPGFEVVKRLMGGRMY